MPFRRFKLLIIGTLMAGSVTGQLTLSGIIIDAESNKPIINAEVYDRNSSQLTKTNDKGYFRLNNLEQGRHQVVVMSLEYQTLEQEVELTRSKEVTMPMEEFRQELSEVVISRRREELFAFNRLRSVEGTAIYAGKKSEMVLMDQFVGNVAANNARQIYSQVVGLNIYESTDAGLQLNVGGRGLNPNRTSNFNTRQNGYDISADVLGYPESYYTPPAEALSQIQVVRGAASLQYGTQFGGLVNFKMKKPATKKMEVTTRQSIGSFGLFSSFNSFGGTVGKFSYYTYFNHKSGNGFRPNSDFNSNNVYGYVEYEIAEHTQINLEATYLYYLAKQAGGLTDSIFNADVLFSNRSRNWFEVDWKLVALKLEHKFSSQSEFSFMLSGLDAKRNALGFRGQPELINGRPIKQEDIRNSDGSYEYERDLIKGVFRNWGFETRYLNRYQIYGKNAVFLIGTKYYHANNEELQGPGTNGTDAKFNLSIAQYPDYPNQSNFRFPNRNLAFFGEHILFLTDQLLITPGFRVEYIKTQSKGTYHRVNFNNAGDPILNEELTDNRELERSFILFGLGISYESGLNTDIYANISKNYRSVTFSDIRVVNPSFVIDPDISDEKGYTFDGGIRGKFKDIISYDISGFGLLYDDRIGIVFNDRANRVRKNIGQALIYGLEMFADFNLAKWVNIDSKQSKLNVFTNLALTNSEYLQSEDNNVRGKKVEFIPIVNLKTGLRFGYKNFLGSFQYTYLSEQFTDVENSEISGEEDARTGLIGPIPAYRIMDFSFSYTYKKWKLETGINNLLDERYFTRRATGYPGPGIIPSDPRSYYLTLQFKM